MTPAASSDAFWEDLLTGDIVFVRPRLDPQLDFDAAILAVGNATIAWVRACYVSENSNETVLHVALAWWNASVLYMVEAVPPVVRAIPAARWWLDGKETAAFYCGRAQEPSMQSVTIRAVGLAFQEVGKTSTSMLAAQPNSFFCSSVVDWVYHQAAYAAHVFVDAAFR